MCGSKASNLLMSESSKRLEFSGSFFSWDLLAMSIYSRNPAGLMVFAEKAIHDARCWCRNSLGLDLRSHVQFDDVACIFGSDGP